MFRAIYLIFCFVARHAIESGVNLIEHLALRGGCRFSQGNPTAICARKKQGKAMDCAGPGSGLYSTKDKPVLSLQPHKLDAPSYVRSRFWRY
ncbi:hypothetical protein [Cupriavidus sp. D39]|uniref:hypothetical protein n=1 Tax=Cupriavidus sp. D39 TaxID=2997877 RepID=UPI00226F1668|nr:hypothetical protein [Cupriavidus sp. D39]MCY0854391.1 hypothetical protein [Cupriavidus sp. D39]